MFFTRMNRVTSRSRQLIRSDSHLRICRPFGSLSPSSSSTPRPKSGWSGLGAFATSDESNAAWKAIKAEEDEVESTIERHSQQGELSKIDWAYWEKTIKHKPIVDCLKSAYMQQVEQIDKALAESSPTSDQKGWELFDLAVTSCEKSVVASEELVADGARALWVSHRNPPAWAISSDEWLDSDLWWQAYVERHHHFDPAKDIESFKTETFEADVEDEALRREWRRKTNLFHDRSDTPTLYQYMDQLHSSDYYDIHRRVFLEHMIYYLARTGNSYHFFPEIPPIQWVSHIEALKFRWTSRAHARRKARQLTSLSREEALDLCPLDSEIEHHGEEHFLKLLLKERSTFESLVARLMADYCFLCHPAMPCSTLASLHRAIATDGGRGKLYSLGSDVASLFYVPQSSSRPFSDRINSSAPRPKESLDQWLGHLATTGAPLNPGYEDILKIHSELLETRGDHWFNAPEESVTEAFIRRLAQDEPSKKVYQLYVQELESRWSSAVELPLHEGFERIAQVESDSRDTDIAFKVFRESIDQSGVQKLREELSSLQSAGKLSDVLQAQGIVLIKNNNEVDSEVVGKELKRANDDKTTILEAINAAKLPTL